MGKILKNGVSYSDGDGGGTADNAEITSEEWAYIMSSSPSQTNANVIYGYLKTADGKFYEENTYTTEITGINGHLYIDLDTNVIYRYNGSIYVQVGTNTASSYSTEDNAETTLADDDYIPFYDTSASDKKKSLWSNIKSVLKTYFDTLYQGKLTAGTNVSFSGNTINVPDNYSTSETVIGTWLNATLYRKVVNIGNLPNNALKQVAHNISGTSKTFVKIYGYVKNSSNQYAPIPISTTTPSICSIVVDQTNINMATNADLSAFSGYLVLEYTK